MHLGIEFVIPVYLDSFSFLASRCMWVGCTYNDNEKRSICSHTLSWIAIITHFAFVFTSCVTMLCLNLTQCSFLWTEGGKSKRTRNCQLSGSSAWLLMVLFGKCGIHWSALSDPLYHTMTGIPPRVILLINAWSAVSCFLIHPFCKCWLLMQNVLAVWRRIPLTFICYFHIYLEMVSILVITGLSLWCLWVSEVEKKWL